VITVTKHEQSLVTTMMDAGATLSRNKETAVTMSDMSLDMTGGQTTSNGIFVNQNRTPAPSFINERHLDSSLLIMMLTSLLLVDFYRTLGIVDRARCCSSGALTSTGEIGAFRCSHDVFSHTHRWTAISERLLNISSFFDTKNEQGTAWCHCYGAKLEHSLA